MVVEAARYVLQRTRGAGGTANAMSLLDSTTTGFGAVDCAACCVKRSVMCSDEIYVDTFGTSLVLDLSFVAFKETGCENGKKVAANMTCTGESFVSS